MDALLDAFLRLISCCFRRRKSRRAPAPSVSAESNAPASVPGYVIKYAPLVYLHPKDPYMPSDIGAQLVHTTPKEGYEALAGVPEPLTLDNLDLLNLQGKDGEDIYLTANDDVSKTPAWLTGVLPDEDGRTRDAVSCVVVTVQKGYGIVDAFYFYFYAYNWGGMVLGKNLGNHVGDWEHTMIRFYYGVPQTVWLSQHAGGQAFTYDAMEKDESGLRPVVYSATGSHANYAIRGTHNHDNAYFHLPTPGFVNDYCEVGPIWDPVKSAYWYSWTPSSTSVSPRTITKTIKSSGEHPVKVTEISTRDADQLGTFVPYDPDTPVRYLYFVGRWGDMRYPKSDPRQDEIFNLAWKYDTGPAGPAFKDLGRKDVWSGNHGPIHDSLVP